MANEITYSSRIAWARGGESVSLSAGDSYTQLGNTAIGRVDYISLTTVAIDFGTVDDPAFVGFRNEAPKFNATTGIPLVQIFLATVTPVTFTIVAGVVTATNASIILDGGQGICVPNGGITWYAISTTATTPLAVVAIQR